MTPKLTRSLARLGAPLLLVVPALSQASFQGLGTGVTASAISPDGQWVTGTAAGGTFLWSSGTGASIVVGLPLQNGDVECSSGASFGCGTYGNPSLGTTEAARWDNLGALQYLGGLGGQSGTSVSSAYGISDSGNVIVGLGWVSGGSAHAFKWTQGAGMLDLGSQLQQSSRANGVSGNGSVVVGWDGSPRQPAIWSGATETRIGSLGVNGEAWAATSDGSVVTGMYQNQLFRWTSAGGMVLLGKLPGSVAADAAWGMDISDSGYTIVGYNGNQFSGTPLQAFVRRPGLGMIDLQSYLSGLGVSSVAGWTLQVALGISADGRTITGYGINPNLAFESWVATIPSEIPITNYCNPGVDGVLSCPCANPPAGLGRGCDNSAATGGASISASGPASLASDGIVFTTAGQRPSGTSVLLQGTIHNSGVPFGQGVRCVAGLLKRLYVKVASGGSITAPQAGDPSVSARSSALGDTIVGGTTREYMVYYRDPIELGGCTGGLTWNATNAGTLFWNP